MLLYFLKIIHQKILAFIGMFVNFICSQKIFHKQQIYSYEYVKSQNKGPHIWGLLILSMYLFFLVTFRNEKNDRQLLEVSSQLVIIHFWVGSCLSYDKGNLFLMTKREKDERKTKTKVSHIKKKRESFPISNVSHAKR